MANLIPTWRDGKQICAALASKLREGVPLDEWERGFVADALQAAADGGNLKQALRLVQTGRPSKVDRDYWIYTRVEELREQGETVAAACRLVATECAQWREFGGLDRYGQPTRLSAWEDVEKIYKRWRRAAVSE